MASARSTEQLLRHHFLSWQCRIRQHAVRMQDGRPSSGMRAVVVIDNQVFTRLIVLINRRDLTGLIPEFRFMYKKTHDPAIRRDSVLKTLVAGHYQHADQFTDRLTALLPAASEITNRILAANTIVLIFHQQNQQYTIPCRVKNLAANEHEFQATYWHNALFNPHLPPSIQILAFDPNWKRVLADPLPNEMSSVSLFQ